MVGQLPECGRGGDHRPSFYLPTMSAAIRKEAQCPHDARATNTVARKISAPTAGACTAAVRQNTGTEPHAGMLAGG